MHNTYICLACPEARPTHPKAIRPICVGCAVRIVVLALEPRRGLYRQTFRGGLPCRYSGCGSPDQSPTSLLSRA